MDVVLIGTWDKVALLREVADQLALALVGVDLIKEDVEVLVGTVLENMT